MYLTRERVPDILTLFRGVATIVIALLFLSSYEERFIAAYALFLLASLSDFFDGFLARRWKITSDFGAIFDPLFDKILVLSLFMLIAPFAIVHPLILIVLLMRDITTDAMRNYLLAHQVVVPAIYLSKWKTVMQIVMLNFALLAIAFPHISQLPPLAQVSGVIAVVLSLISGNVYLRGFMKFARERAASSST